MPRPRKDPNQAANNEVDGDDLKGKKGEQASLSPEQKRLKLVELRDSFFSVSAEIAEEESEVRSLTKRKGEILNDVKEIAFGKKAKGIKTSQLISALRDVSEVPAVQEPA